MVTHQTIFVKVFRLSNNYSVYQAQTYRLSSTNISFIKHKHIVYQAQTWCLYL